MENVFCQCKSLITLPDIFKWNTENAEDMTSVSYECKSLIVLPAISKWNISKVKSRSSIFDGYKLLISYLKFLNSIIIFWIEGWECALRRKDTVFSEVIPI